MRAIMELVFTDVFRQQGYGVPSELATRTCREEMYSCLCQFSDDQVQISQ